MKKLLCLCLIALSLSGSNLALAAGCGSIHVTISNKDVSFGGMNSPEGLSIGSTGPSTFDVSLGAQPPGLQGCSGSAYVFFNVPKSVVPDGYCVMNFSADLDLQNFAVGASPASYPSCVGTNFYNVTFSPQKGSQNVTMTFTPIAKK